MRIRLAHAAAIPALAAVLVSTPSASAAPGGSPAQPVITQVKTAAAFDFAAGDSPENINVNPDGSLTVSLLGVPANKPPKLIRITPSGQRTTLVDGHLGDQITGNTRGSDGTVYYNVDSDDASRNGTWKLPPHGRPRRLAALPDGLPNGLAIDRAGRTLYAADSYNGTVWAVPISGGPARVWLSGPALAADPDGSLPLGVNGVRFHKGAVWVSNYSQGKLLRIPVTAHGTPGRIHTVADNIPDFDDFAFLNNRSDTVFAAQNDPTDRVSVVHPNGTHETALTVDDGLASPTTTAVRGNQLFIANAGFNAPHDAKLQSGTINLHALTPHPRHH
ncbi:SMP-30/gluconolactonase/LRE family protein [Streptomyces sp. NBC_00365]|uniref:SMP-30/gluconolactonase/LRE family protein n=1 Tax=Streptomyces sp. NBC_00365 TaxID=2975726 RepID=UPI00224EAB9D|nr:SMP-30/gluconolactonase/LRE family protein [Streptomyces sp. NBC_00365]MCX5097691.1 SMP-30/gluconolactonase/LRE family protein [Streptomyces sp. NBC_00365]